MLVEQIDHSILDIQNIWGRSDKHLASPPDGASIPRVEASLSTDFRKMEKEQYRLVIGFLFLQGKSRSKIKERLDAVYSNSFPLMATVKNWFNEF